MKKYLYLVALIACFHPAFSQIQDGELSPDIIATDINGVEHNLYASLNQGKTVVLHFFATWDSFSWDYFQSSELQDFNALYGNSGSGLAEVWSIESEPSNSLAQLQGPQSLTGENATQTYGDWTTDNNVVIIDDASVAGLFGLSSLPAVLVICPDAVVSVVGEYSSETLYNGIMAGCDQLTLGSDPALINATLFRSCGSDVADASVIIKNLGTSLLESLDIQFAGTAGEPVLNWSGSLESYRSDTVQYSGLQLLNDDPVRIRIISANDNLVNDSLDVFADAGLSMMRVQLELALDEYPEEVSWEIRDSDENVIFSDGEFAIGYEYFNLTFDLPQAGCYTFELFDTAGDGLHGSQYGGFDGSCYLRSLDEAGNVTAVLYANNGSYNFDSTSESVLFEAGSPLQIDEKDDASLVIFPNPVSDELSIRWQDSNHDPKVIRIFDSSGKHLHEFQTSSDYFSIDCARVDNGVYTLVVIQNGKIWTTRILVLQH